jgi:hypothetical protein
MNDYEPAALQTAAPAEDDAQTTFIVADDDGEILDESERNGRPEDCQCWDADAALPCFPCYRDGFEDPNPNIDDDREGGDA